MKTLSIEAISVEKPFTASLIRTGKFPLNGDAAAEALAAINEQLSPFKGTNRSVFLQHQYLPNGKETFNEHLQQWRPESGLGVWPDREAPRLWKTADFFRMARGESMPLMYRVFRLGGDAASSAQAVELLAGSGMVMVIAHTATAEVILKQYKDTYLPGITQPNLRMFPFYVPLLDVKSVKDRKAQELQKWLGGARFYLRESPQDNGILVISAG